MKNYFKINIPRTSKVLHGPLLCILAMFFSSCESLVEVDLPTEVYISRENVYSNEETAEAAARGMYTSLKNNLAFGGTSNALHALCGLTSDELFYPAQTDLEVLQFEQNALLADNNIIERNWRSLYESIYAANMVIEGVSGSETLPDEFVGRLTGEALFVRSFAYFFLINLFGDVPLVLTSDYKENATIARSPIKDIYGQIRADLEHAIEILPVEYVGRERVRTNRSVATALLARVYLFLENWEGAEAMATELINNNSYELVALDEITLANNLEAIWQFHPSSTGTNVNTNEAYYFSRPQMYNALTEDLVNAFESEDARKEAWINVHTSGLYMPYKYQVTVSGGARNEYSTILRLAEQYLIRAEARAQLGNIPGAITDVDVIRGRANLPLLSDMNPGISKTGLLDVIMSERRLEFFAESGMRWLDLKRTGTALEALINLKPEITTTDLLWPIPQQELNNNPSLRDHQNPGY